jgi:uncharacterized membrane protein
MKRAHRSTPGTATERHAQRTRNYDRDVEPVSYFNDAVFAIAMTLLVVSIRVPSGTSAETLGRALRGLGSSFTSYGISFIVIGLYWLAFHRQLRYLERFDATTLVIDLLFLMSVAFLPFPTLLPAGTSGRFPSSSTRQAWPQVVCCSGSSGSIPPGADF